jgi:hypothetical protein
VTTKIARLLALSVAPLTLTAVACSSSGGSTAAPPPPPSPTPVATTPSASATPDACAAAVPVAAAKPPSNVPTPADATFYEKVPQGATTQYFAYAPGDNVRTRRDAIKTQLSKAGYDIKGSDAEANEEADLEFEGKGHGESTVQVIHRPGCESQLRIRYKLGH